MKLAEGLARRSDAQKRLALLQARAVACARYQEGEAPAENAADLLAEARTVGDEIEDLIRRINRTNAATELESGITITDAIAIRDMLAKRRGVIAAVADAAVGRERGGWGRQLRSERRAGEQVAGSGRSEHATVRRRSIRWVLGPAYGIARGAAPTYRAALHRARGTCDPGIGHNQVLADRAGEGG